MSLYNYLCAIGKNPTNYLWQNLIKDVSARLIQKAWYENGWKMIIRRKHIRASRFFDMKLLEWTYSKLKIVAYILDRKSGKIRLEEITYYRDSIRKDFRHITTVHHRSDTMFPYEYYV